MWTLESTLWLLSVLRFKAIARPSITYSLKVSIQSITYRVLRTFLNPLISSLDAEIFFTPLPVDGIILEHVFKHIWFSILQIKSATLMQLFLPVKFYDHKATLYPNIILIRLPLGSSFSKYYVLLASNGKVNTRINQKVKIISIYHLYFHWWRTEAYVTFRHSLPARRRTSGIVHWASLSLPRRSFSDDHEAKSVALVWTINSYKHYSTPSHHTLWFGQSHSWCWRLPTSAKVIRRPSLIKTSTLWMRSTVSDVD